MSTRWLLLGVLGPALLCCSSENTAADGGVKVSDGAPNPSTALVGTFQVSLVAPVAATGTPGFTSVVGKVNDGPTPSPIVWEEAAKEGGCSLFTPRVPFCADGCEGGAVCVENDRCQEYPTSHSVGTVRVKGIRTSTGATEFSMDPVSNGYQTPSGVSLPYPAFAEGDAISAEASGGDFEAFTLKSTGISPLTLADGALTLEANQPLKLGWTPPGKTGISTVHVKLDISHHGGSKGMITCDVEDNGSLELSASITGQLKALGVAGFPTIVLSRRAVGSTTISVGRVELAVCSEVEKEVKIPGLVSCNKPEDCPKGQTCQADLTCK
jgi:hypothetical protein